MLKIETFLSLEITIVDHRQKKAHIMEVQLNGGSIADKVKHLWIYLQFLNDDNNGITI